MATMKGESDTAPTCRILQGQARVAFYRVKPGTADELIARVEADLAGTYRNHAGFVA